MAQFHLNELSTSCRVCGCKTGDLNYTFKTTTKHVAQKLSAFGLAVEEDNHEIHPQNVCLNCYTKSAKAYKNTNSYCSSVSPVVWLPHQETNCNICSLFVKRNRGGKKKRERKGRGRPKKASKNTDSSSHSVIVSIPSEIIPAALINPMPSIERFSNISEELICPICREVLNIPLQGTLCDHFYCYQCIKSWLNCDGVGCPVCKREVGSQQLRKPPRLLLNLLSSSCVECTICKSFINLEHLSQHESICTSYVTERCTKLITDILKTSTTTPLSQTEETLTTHLMKRKLASSDSQNVLLRTGGTVTVSKRFSYG